MHHVCTSCRYAIINIQVALGQNLWAQIPKGRLVGDPYTLQETNISPFKGTFEEDFPFPQVGYVSSLEAKPICRHLRAATFSSQGAAGDLDLQIGVAAEAFSVSWHT